MIRYEEMMFGAGWILDDEELVELRQEVASCVDLDRAAQAVERYEERAAICEYEGGRSRMEAERQGIAEALEWLRYKPSAPRVDAIRPAA
jgi:hypothetical protein